MGHPAVFKTIQSSASGGRQQALAALRLGMTKPIKRWEFRLTWDG